MTLFDHATKKHTHIVDCVFDEKNQKKNKNEIQTEIFLSQNQKLLDRWFYRNQMIDEHRR